MASSKAPFRSSLLLLYKKILIQHRQSLPSELKSLGDEYVRAEFKAIKKAKKKEHIEQFLGKWHEYMTIITSPRGQVGKKLEPKVVDKLSLEQKEQLRKLKNAALSIDQEGDKDN